MTVSDHGLNASTFAARVDRLDAGGPDLGGAGRDQRAEGAAARRRAGAGASTCWTRSATPDNAEAWIEAALARGDRLMGFGHRVYKVRDPRADALKGAVRRPLPAPTPCPAGWPSPRRWRSRRWPSCKDTSPTGRCDTNVEFYTALLLEALASRHRAFTCVFAIGRVAGWIAHAREQVAGGRLIRPQSHYVGPRP